MRRIVAIFALLLTLLPLSAAPVSAGAGQLQSGRLSMAVQVGYDNTGRLGSWIPVRVDVANQGSTVSGLVEIDFEGAARYSFFAPPPATYSVAASFPEGSRKSIVVDVPVPPAVNSNRVQVTLVSGGQTVIKAEQEFTPVPAGTVYCGVLDSTAGSYDFLSRLTLASAQNHPVVVGVTPADLPSEASLLSGLNCLIVGDVNLSDLVSSQRDALAAWVASGGTLIVSGGVNWRQSVPYLPPVLLPETVQRVETRTDAAALSQFLRVHAPDSGLWAFAVGPLNNGGTVLAGSVSNPLLAVKRVGAGEVFYSAADSTQEPANSWAGKSALWSYMLNFTSAPITASSYASYRYYLDLPLPALSQLPSLSPPHPFPILAVLLLQALLVLPLSWWYLRRLDRVAWIGVVLPVWLLVSTMAALKISTSYQASDVAETQVSEISLQAGSPIATIRTYVGLYAPQLKTVDVTGPHGILLSPARRTFGQIVQTESATRITVEEGIDTEAPAVTLLPRALSIFSVDSQARMGAGVAIALIADSHGVHGQVSNHLGQTLDNALLIVGPNVIELGSLSNGATRSVSAKLDYSAPENSTHFQQALADALGTRGLTGPRRDGINPQLDLLLRAFPSGMLSSGARSGGVYVVGWLEHSPSQVTVRRARAAQRSLTVAVIAVPLQIDASTLRTISPSLLVTLPLVRVGVTGDGPNRYSLSTGGSLAVEYDLPEIALHRSETFHLNVEGGYSGGSAFKPGDSLGDVSFFDWRTQQWEARSLRAGSNTYESVSDFLSPTGAIRLRYSFKPDAGSSATGVDFSSFAFSIGFKS
ncbi:MAG: hypothetical protein M1118_10750 [Chloroflexi bacterium]|nr:hypothetical protein [Chloroflexota bacterium]